MYTTRTTRLSCVTDLSNRPPHRFHGQEACSAFADNVAKFEAFTGLKTQASTKGTQESVVSF